MVQTAGVASRLAQRWRSTIVSGESIRLTRRRGLSFDKKLEQFKAILDDLAQYPSDMPAIVMGDLNTWEADAGRKTIKFFTDAGLKTPFGGQATFRAHVSARADRD